MAKMIEGSKEYCREAANIALGRVDILPCIKCGHPIVDGFCCQHCGSGDGAAPGCDASFIEI